MRSEKLVECSTIKVKLMGEMGKMEFNPKIKELLSFGVEICGSL
jgi:hypothetical protein